MRSSSLPVSPRTTAILLAAGRIAVGVTAYLAPTVGGPAFVSGRLPPEGVDGWRLAGARDVVLGVGAVMAGRRGEGRLRGWVEAGALADVLDVIALGTSPGLRPIAKVGGAGIAASAAILGFLTARELARD